MEAKEEEAEVATIINEDTQFAEDQEDAATVFTDAVVSNPDNDQEDAATVLTMSPWFRILTRLPSSLTTVRRL